MIHPHTHTDTPATSSPRQNSDRRDFLKAAAGLPLTLATAQLASSAAPVPASSAPATSPKPLPHVALGKHSISRLVCGANPFNAGSHLSTFVNREMKSYFTPDQILKTLRRCQEEGINTWQSTIANLALYRRHVELGGNLQFMAIEKNDPAMIAKLVQGGAIAIAHHGEATDQLFKTGKLDQVGEFLQRVRDAGVLAGVSTHMPDVVDAIEAKGWPVDYYMACVYQRHRTEAELQALMGQVPLPVGEVYLKSDPPRMFKMIRQTRRPCLAFKILAAGRLSEKKELVEAAFRETYAAIKPTDGVIVGIYDRYSDQVAENATLVRRFAV